jgi:Family of unknown function (DUF5343)
MDDAQRYTTVPNALEKLLDKIPTLGRPDKVNSSWLASIGMGGGNNQSMIRVLKGLGAIGTDGVPTDTWTAIRAEDKPRVGAAVRTVYSDLFSIYPDAHKKDAEALVAFFRANTDLGEKAQRLSVQTFQVLCKFGDFSAEAAADALAEHVQRESPPSGGSSKKPKEREPLMPPAVVVPPVALTVNLQLQLPASADGDVYEKLFSAMAKHLKGLITP